MHDMRDLMVGAHERVNLIDEARWRTIIAAMQQGLDRNASPVE